MKQVDLFDPNPPVAPPLQVKPGDIERTAVLSECGRYRYRLTRRWGEGPLAVFVMLNPSVADAQVDDPTLRKCMTFARAWGDAGVLLVNLFAYRATDPDNLPEELADAVGPENDEHLRQAVRGASRVVCAWGIHGPRFGRDRAVLELLRSAGADLLCLGKTKKGHPNHPLYLPNATRLERV